MPRGINSRTKDFEFWLNIQVERYSRQINTGISLFISYDYYAVLKPYRNMASKKEMNQSQALGM
jgi:hypothetical protein